LFYVAKSRYADLVASNPDDKTLRKAYSLFLLDNGYPE
jgi:hypothetical protein